MKNERKIEVLQKARYVWLMAMLSLYIVQTASQSVYGIPGFFETVPSTSTPIMNVMTCAVMCKKNACTTFYHQNATCYIGGINQTNASSTQLYKRKYPNESYAYQVLPPNLPAIASTSYASEHAPSKAVDTDLGTWFCSNFDVPLSWWRLDLGDELYVHKIDILPRNHPADAANFQDVEIRVGTTDLSSGNFTPWTLFGQYVGPYSPDKGRLVYTSDEGIPARYISVQRGANTIVGALKILDFKVYVRVH